jgi:hypothetical protein
MPDYWANVYFKTNFNLKFYLRKYEIFDIKIISLESSFEYESNGIIFIFYIFLTKIKDQSLSRLYNLAWRE